MPAIVDRDLNVIAGHGRILACKPIGVTEVPTISLDHLSESQAKAFTIADNRLSETSTWDERLLGEQLKELSLQELDFSIEATGFEIGEIDLRIEALSKIKEAEEDPADTIPSSRDVPVVSKPGDLWLLRRHRVYCGNALEPTAFTALLEDIRAAMVFTDPPFNVPIAGNVSGLGSIQHQNFKMGCGEMTSEEHGIPHACV